MHSHNRQYVFKKDMGESVLDLFTVYMSWLQEWSRRHGDWGMEMAASTAQK